MMKISRAVQAHLKRNGFVFLRVNGHYRYRHQPSGSKLTLASSPSCPFVEKKQIADINRIVRRNGDTVVND